MNTPNKQAERYTEEDLTREKNISFDLGKAQALADELRFLQWVKVMLLNIDYEDGLNDKEIKFEKRIEELKQKLQELK